MISSLLKNLIQNLFLGRVALICATWKSAMLDFKYRENFSSADQMIQGLVRETGGFNIVMANWTCFITKKKKIQVYPEYFTFFWFFLYGLDRR